jgi:cell division protein FtsQ
MIFPFAKKRSNKKIVKTKRAAPEKRPFRKNRFKKEPRLKDPNRKIKLYYFFQIIAGLTTAVLMSVLLIFVHDLFTQTNYFNIKNIDIKGLCYLPEKDIMEQSGITKGDNILGVNLNLARKKLLAHPWIEKVQVSRLFPGGIIIDITEYQPEAIAKIKDEQYLLSSKGVLFKSLTDSDPTNLPIITGLSYSDIPVANLPASDQFEAVRKVLKMGRSSMALIPASKIKEIKMDGELGLALILIEPSLLIQIGYEHYPEKYQNLTRVFKYLKNGNEQIQISEIDLSDLNQIVVTPTISKKSHQS